MEFRDLIQRAMQIREQSVIMLAEYYGINLEQAFMGMMDEIEAHIKSQPET